MCLLFVKTVVVIIKSTEVPLNTLYITQMYSKCVPGEGEGGIIPYIGYIGVCGDQFRPVWSGYVFFLSEATSSSLGDKTISLWVLGQPGTFRNSELLYSFVSCLIKPRELINKAGLK